MVLQPSPKLTPDIVATEFSFILWKVLSYSADGIQPLLFLWISVVAVPFLTEDNRAERRLLVNFIITIQESGACL